MPPKTKTGFGARRARKAAADTPNTAPAPTATDQQPSAPAVPLSSDPAGGGGETAPERRADRVLGLEEIPAPAPPSGPEITLAERARLEVYSDVLEQSKDSRYAVGKVLSGLEAGDYFDRGLGVFRTDLYAELDISSSDADRMMKEWPQAEAFQRRKVKVPPASHVRALLSLAEQFTHDAAVTFHDELTRRADSEGIRLTEQIVKRQVARFIRMSTNDADLAATDTRSLSGPADGAEPLTEEKRSTSDAERANSLTALVGVKARELLGEQPLIPEPRSQKVSAHPAVQEAQRLAKLAKDLHQGCAGLNTANLDVADAARVETALTAAREAAQQAVDVLRS
jgi:hypothetical protein